VLHVKLQVSSKEKTLSFPSEQVIAPLLGSVRLWQLTVKWLIKKCNLISSRIHHSAHTWYRVGSILLGKDFIIIRVRRYHIVRCRAPLPSAGHFFTSNIKKASWLMPQPKCSLPLDCIYRHTKITLLLHFFWIFSPFYHNQINHWL